MENVHISKLYTTNLNEIIEVHCHLIGSSFLKKKSDGPTTIKIGLKEKYLIDLF